MIHSVVHFDLPFLLYTGGIVGNCVPTRAKQRVSSEDSPHRLSSFLPVRVPKKYKEDPAWSGYLNGAIIEGRNAKCGRALKRVVYMAACSLDAV